MRITPNAEAEELRSIVREFLGRYGDTEAVYRELAGERGWDPAVWSRLGAELGAVTLDVPAALGGSGATFREVAVVAEELGRSLVRLPWFGTAVLAVGALLAAEGPVRDELLTRLATGPATATLAYQEHSPVTAVRSGPGWRLDGTKTLVVEGASAELLLVTAGDDLFAVEGDAPGLTREPLRAMDPNRQLATVILDGAEATLVGRADLGRVRARAIAALACEQSGGAAAALDLSCRYAGDRIQFGRPIATFQAIKHRCADMAVHVEAARSASLWAAGAVADGAPDVEQAAAAAALTCGEAYTWVAAETVQVHGGIGFTWEHPAHLHVRRAATSAVLFGQPHEHREELLGALGV
ncbi:acyl-CoA dehydrogenase family protein [Prauserella flavalba]|uniref:Acyl-CoA dehydrogenase n=1 Tax=Prauserella flavalba TaxID=1477506 RepID=A0A318LLJ9_9PSEU|nr:acyl-CoA dehydrogenase family protein [Prauserella flavalba]PXY35343.1 acyl-CoA dehydrogenase [Prauserella flavalba]